MGIDPERFVYAVPQDSFCVLCSSVLQDPVEVIKCGHYVCSSCWDTWIHNDIDGKCKSESKIVTCPYCGIDIDIGGIRKSKITWNLIQNMNVYCTHKSAGCESIYKLGFDDLHSKNCVYQQDGMDTGKLEKCDTCNLTITENLRSHSCVKELLQNIKQQSTGITNLEHENNRLTFKLTTFEKEFMEERAELEGQFFEESLKYGKEIRDLRTRLACLQGELSRRKGQSEVENLTIELERVNGSLGFNIIGGATKDDRLSSGIYVSRIVEGGAADGPGKLQLHDCILEVDGVNLRNATHELAVKTFRNSGNPFKMVIQRIINKVHSCDAETQTFGVAFAVTGENDQIDKPVRSFQNNKSRWLTPHEIADSAHLSGSDECVSVIPQNNKEEQRKNDDYDSAYDTLLTQKSFRSTRSPSLNENSDSSCTTLKTTTSPDCSETHSVVLRTKVTSTDSDNRRHSTFYVIPSEEQKNADNKSWEDIQTCGENEAEYEYEYEEVSLRKEEGKLGMVLCYGGDEKDVAVYIGDLEDNSVADISGKVMVGDQIVQINGTQVMNVEQAYSMLQQSDEITLVVARAVYENHTDYYDEAEETDLDMLDCINEEAESVFSKESSPMYASSNSSKSSSPKVNRKTGGDGSSPVSPLSSTVPSSETGRERAMTLSPVNSSSNEDFQLPERRSRSISVNDNGSIDEKLERQRNSSAENKNEKESNIKSSLKNFVKTRLGSSEKKGRSSSHSDESCELNKIPRCDSNSSNNSNRSKHSSEKENSLSPQEQLKARLKEQRNQSKMKAYLDSPSLQRHRVNNNNMFVNQNGFSLVNSPANFSGKMMNVPVFTPVNMPHKNMTQFHPGMFHGMPTLSRTTRG